MLLKDCVDCGKRFTTTDVRGGGGPHRSATVLAAPLHSFDESILHVLTPSGGRARPFCSRCGSARASGILVGQGDGLHFRLQGTGVTSVKRTLGLPFEKCWVPVVADKGNLLPDLVRFALANPGVGDGSGRAWIPPPLSPFWTHHWTDADRRFIEGLEARGHRKQKTTQKVVPTHNSKRVRPTCMRMLFDAIDMLENHLHVDVTIPTP